jgi:multiple sugar transport system substrate-binding protein
MGAKGAPARLTRRRLIVLGTAGLGMSLLTACGQAAPAAKSDAKPAEAKPAQQAAQAQPTAKPAEAAKPTQAAAQPAQQAAPAKGASQVNLTWITPAEVGLERDFYTGFYEDFQKQNPNVKVQVSFEAWSDYQTKLPTILAGGSIPDVIHLHASIAQDYGQRGAVRDLYQLMDRDKLSRDDFFPFLLKQMADYKTQTKLWAIPKDSAVYAIYYNKDLFDKAGAPYPKLGWTFEEFRETARKATLDRNGNNPTSPSFDANNIVQWGMNWGDNPTDSPLPGSDQWQNIAWGQAGHWFSDDLTRANFDSPDHIKFLQDVIDMRCQDRSIPQSGDSMGQGNAFRNGLVAMSIAHHSMVFFMNAEKKTFKYDVTWPPGGKHGTFQAAGCSGWAIPTRAPNADVAWEFVKFLVSQEQQCKIVAAKRWGAPILACQENLLPVDGNPPSFREVLYDPMFGKTPVKTQAIIYPPFLNEMRQIWRTEYDPLFNCGGGSVAEASKRAQPQIQALIDRARSM